MNKTCPNIVILYWNMVSTMQRTQIKSWLKKKLFTNFDRLWNQATYFLFYFYLKNPSCIPHMEAELKHSSILPN